MLRTGRLLFAIATVLAIGLGVLAAVQWRWIGELSTAQEERERRVLGLAARQFADEIDRDAARLIESFQNSDPSELARRTEEWRAAARDRRLLEAVYAFEDEQLSRLGADGKLVAAEWPEALAAVRKRIGAGPAGRRGPLVPEVPAILMPMRPRPRQDAPLPVAGRSLATRFAGARTAGGDGRPEEQGWPRPYPRERNGDEGVGPDGRPRPGFFGGPPPREGGFGFPSGPPPGRGPGGPPPRERDGFPGGPPPRGFRPPRGSAEAGARPGEASAADSTATERRPPLAADERLQPAPRPRERPLAFVVLEIGRPYLTGVLSPELAKRLGNAYDVAVTDGSTIVYRSNPRWPATASERAEVEVPLLRVGGPMRGANGWLILVRYHDATVADLVAAARKRNIAVSLAVLSVLALSFVLLAMIARRAERLRVEQLEFVAGITHELNTPLAAIRSAGQNLADGVVADGQGIARYGTMIARESKRLADLVAQVLDYAGVQARSAPPRTRIDLAALVDEVIEQSRWLADENGVTVEVTVASGLPAIEGDAPAIGRAVQNLLANAIRHGSAGKWAGVSVTPERGGVAITVADHGPGVAAADIPRLFDPFYRGRRAERVRGSGLGLSIVKEIARRHGGRVTVEKKRVRGAAFTLHLPERSSAAAMPVTANDHA